MARMLDPNQVILLGALAAWLVLGSISGVHAIMYKRDPKGAAVWLFIGFTLPIVGPWFYWVFGINRIERRAAKRRAEKGSHVSLPVHVLATSAEHLAAIGHLQPLALMSNRVTRMPLLSGNRLEPLHNGEQAYPAMLEAIANARETVTLESYIFDWDVAGRRFADALGEAASRGVRVHLLADGIGALGNFSRMARRLLRSGARVAAFFPLRVPFGRFRLNLRNHRKLLIVDGRLGFTGGMNISSRHMLDSDSPNRVEDVHFRVTGPVVAEMQQAFVEDWLLATDESLSGADFFPTLAEAGPALCRAIISGPDEDFEKIHWILLAALAAAQSSVHIATPYFVPTHALLASLSMAALRGVEVTLFLPANTDLPYMRWVADAYLWQLLEHGIRVYRRIGPFVHSKLVAVDRRWVLIGSANLDPRSFRLNFEFNVEAYDPGLASQLCGWLDGQIPDCEPVTLQAIDGRSMPRRFRDGLVKLLSPHL